MASLEDLIAQMQVELEASQNRQRRATAEITLIIDTATREGRSNLTDEEDSRVTELFAQRDLAKSDEDGINHKLAKAQRVKDEERATADRARTGHTPGALPTSREYEPRAVVTREEHTYSRQSDPGGSQFLRDVCRQYIYQDPAANARLTAHMHEERVDRAGQPYLERTPPAGVGTGAFAGLTVPQYLTDMYAPATAALRPFADICNGHPLPPSGMSVNISRITTASSVGLQASENADVGGTAMDDTLLTIPVQTAAGQQIVSRQAVDRGTGIDDVILQDMFKRYATTLDSTLITQAVTGLSAVATSTAFTTGSPTVALLYPKILSAASGVEAALLAMGTPSHAIMHSRRWYWMESQLTTSWPLINNTNLPVYAGGTADPASSYNKGIRGRLPSGLGVVVDNNIATNSGAGTEDELYVVPESECHLWEDANAPLFIRAEQPSAPSLGILLVVYGYFAYTFGRYANGMQKVNGTGMIAPTF